MRIQEAANEYRYAILQLADYTQAWYLRRVEHFARWCAGQGIVEVGQIRPTTVARYLHELSSVTSQRTGSTFSSWTIHGYAGAIRTFLYWCAAEPQRYCSRSIPANIAMPKIKQTVIEIYSKEEIARLFAACDDAPFTPALAARNKAILAVLLDTGIRAAELCGLRLEHVHLAPREGHIRVCGKGDKEREIGLGTKSRQLLYIYIKKYRPRRPIDEAIVFLSHHRQQLTPNGLDQILHDLSIKAKVADCHAHKFRHTFAVNFLLQGGDIYVLSRLMGHSSVKITEIYLRAIKGIQARQQSKSVLDNLR